MYNHQSTSEKEKRKKFLRLPLKGTQSVFKHLPFVYFVGLLTLIYIANVHKAERKIRKIEHLKEEVSESGWEYQSLKSEVNYQGIQSSTEERVKASGLEPSKAAPSIIVIDRKE